MAIGLNEINRIVLEMEEDDLRRRDDRRPKTGKTRRTSFNLNRDSESEVSNNLRQL
jgi:hypothetical protein